MQCFVPIANKMINFHMQGFNTEWEVTNSSNYKVLYVNTFLRALNKKQY